MVGAWGYENDIIFMNNLHACKCSNVRMVGPNTHSNNPIRRAGHYHILPVPLKEFRHSAAQKTKVIGIKQVSFSQQSAIHCPQTNLVPGTRYNITL